MPIPCVSTSRLPHILTRKGGFYGDIIHLDAVEHHASLRRRRKARPEVHDPVGCRCGRLVRLDPLTLRKRLPKADPDGMNLVDMIVLAEQRNNGLSSLLGMILQNASTLQVSGSIIRLRSVGLTRREGGSRGNRRCCGTGAYQPSQSRDRPWPMLPSETSTPLAHI